MPRMKKVPRVKTQKPAIKEEAPQEGKRRRTRLDLPKVEQEVKEPKERKTRKRKIVEEPPVIKEKKKPGRKPKNPPPELPAPIATLAEEINKQKPKRIRLDNEESQWLHSKLAESFQDTNFLPIPTPPKVQNLVASFSNAASLDLKHVCFSLRNAEYDPRKINGVIFRLPEPRVTATIFRNGRTLITGAKNSNEASLAAAKVCRILNLIGYPNAIVDNFRVESIVITADFRFPVRIENVAKDHPAVTTYEPDVFPGIIYRHSRGVFLVFVTGKMLITGNTDIDDLKIVFEEVYHLFCNYRN